MKPVALALQKECYDTLSITYPSTDKNLDGIAAHLREKQLSKKFCKNTDKAPIVMHSIR